MPKDILPGNPSFLALRKLSQFEQLEHFFPRWQGRFEQFSSGRFEGTLLGGQSGRVRASSVAVSQSVLVRGQEGPGLITIAQVHSENAGCLWQGKRLDPGWVILRSGEVQTNHLTSRRAVITMLTMPESWFRTAARSITQTDPGQVAWLPVQPSPAAFEALRRETRRILEAAGEGSIASRDVAMLEQSCVRAVVEAVYETPKGADLSSPGRASLVSQAEELMRAHLRKPLGEIDLCEELAVSGRTLRRAFHLKYGLGPMAYYQTLRLNAARSALLAASPEGESIASVGPSFGFHHLGKFAGYYRRLFGELPSKTRLH